MEPSKVIASCTGGFRNLSFGHTLAALSDMGIHCVEGTTDGRAHLFEYIFKGKDPEEIEKMLATHRMKLVAVSGGWSDFAVADRYLEKQYNSLRRQFEFCKRLGVQILRIFASHLPGQYIEERIRERIIQNMRRIMPEAKASGLILAMENHYGVTASADDMLRIIEGVAHSFLKVTFDAANFVSMNEDPIEACKKLLPYIGHVHLKGIRRTSADPDYENAYLTGRDMHRGYEFCSVGEGMVDDEAILELLSRNSYDGFYSLEYENTEDPLEGTQRSLGHIKKVFDLQSV